MKQPGANFFATATNRKPQTAAGILAAIATASSAISQTAVPREQACAWGDNLCGQCFLAVQDRSVTLERNVIQISAGAYHTLVLRNDGTIEGTQIYNQYGTQNYGQSPLHPAGRYKCITAGGFTSAAVVEDGSIRGWGQANQYWSRPAEQFEDVSGSKSEMYPNFIARRRDGSISSTLFPAYQPMSRKDDAGVFQYISAGYTDTFAIRPDGSLWSHTGSWNTRTDLPALTQVSEGGHHIMFLRASDGAVLCEGCSTSTGSFVQVAAGLEFCAALNTQGEVVAWTARASFDNPQYQKPAYLAHARWAALAVGQRHLGAILTPCYSDIDLNRTTDASDLSLALLDFGTCTNCDADLDEDGEVTTADVSLLLLSWGDCP